MLTTEEIEATYGELEKMFVSLDPRPELGLGYIRERLTLCRAMQDRASELRLKVNRELTDVFQRHWVAVQELEIKSTPEHKLRVRELDVVKNRHAMLAKMVGAQMQVLSRTAMDIRLLADITKQQLQRGEINPEEVPGLVKNVPVEALSPFPKVDPGTSPFPDGDTGAPVNPLLTGLTVPQSEPLGSGSTLQSLSRPEPTQLVGFDAPVPGVPAEDDRTRLAETQAVSIEDLFQELNHVGPRPF